MKLMSPMVGSSVFCYLDDLITFSYSFEQHLVHLGQVFDKLRYANLKLNPKKISLFKQHVNVFRVRT